MNEKCTCHNLDSFSKVFSEIFNEPIQMVDVDCPIHGEKAKLKKPKKTKDKTVKKTA